MIFTIVLAIIIIIIIMFVFVFYLQWSVCRYDKIDSSIDETEKNNLQSIFLPPKYLSDSLKYISFWTQYYLIKYSFNVLDYFPSYKC